MLGYDAAVVYLTSKDTEEQIRLYHLAKTTREIQRRHDLERANQIAKEVGKLFG